VISLATLKILVEGGGTADRTAFSLATLADDGAANGPMTTSERSVNIFYGFAPLRLYHWYTDSTIMSGNEILSSDAAAFT